MNPQEAKEQIGASHYMTMKNGVTPQMYYRIEPVKIVGGEIYQCLQFYSECGGGWLGSGENVPSAQEGPDSSKAIFIRERLIAI